jgi:hypothetical protein
MDAWWSLYIHGCPTTRAALAAASTTDLSRDTLGWGWGCTGGEEVVSNECGDMTMNLHEVVESGNVSEVKRLVAAGADVEEELGEYEDRPLHVAAGCGHVEVIKVLVEAGADKDAKNAGGVTPLHDAAGKGYVEAITVLAQLGADISARMVNGETPLQTSIRLGHHQAAQVLRELESTARAQQAAAKERAQQAAEQDFAEKREAADRVAAELLEEEEREEAAKTKVRVAPPLASHWAPQRAVG